MSERYTTIADVIDAITPAFGEYGNDYDIEAIARATYTWTVDTDEQGNELLNTAGFEQTVTDDEFWAIAAQHDTTAQGKDDEDEATATATLNIEERELVHGDGYELSILDDAGTQILAPAVLGLPVGTDHDMAKDDAEDVLKAQGWETVGDWEQLDSCYTIRVRRA